MTRDLVSVDIIVNAAGAMIILFFLFIIRATPQQDPEPQQLPPTTGTPQLSLMNVEVEGQVDDLALLLCKIGPDGTSALPCLRGGAGSAAASETFRQLRREAGGTLPEAVLLLVQCPGPEAKWQLRITYGTFGRPDLTNQETRIRVAVRLEDLETSGLSGFSVQQPNQSGTSQRDRRSAELSTEINTRDDLILTWSVENGGDCG